MSILITGVAGFIGSTLALKLLTEGKSVMGIDNLSDYYDIGLKKDRLALCKKFATFTFVHCDIVDRESIKKLFLENKFSYVIHLAAQPGVRYSVSNPEIYINTNLVGFSNLLECCRQAQVKHFIYASSSSVYGANTAQPFSEHDGVDHPVSLYGATKRANELIAHSYAHLYGLPSTGLRFFTVYGPWCRPDMALFKFTNQILNNQAIQVFNYGEMARDFTYIDDIVSGIIRVIETIPQPTNKPINYPLSPAESHAPFRIYNLGSQHPIRLIEYIHMLEHCLHKKAVLEMMPMQLGDVRDTFANTKDFEQTLGKLPHTSIEVGISRFVEWFKSYYACKKVTLT